VSNARIPNLGAMGLLRGRKRLRHQFCQRTGLVADMAGILVGILVGILDYEVRGNMNDDHSSQARPRKLPPYRRERRYDSLPAEGGTPATRFMRSSTWRLNVTTCGQRKHAARPSC
jgi:hypothetical protein